MKKLRSRISRRLVTLAVTGLALAFTAGAASADPVTFTVHEDPAILPGSLDNTFDADTITGKYVESLTLNMNGTFTAVIVVEFASYADGGTLQGSQLNNIEPIGYGMYATTTVSGTYVTNADPSPTNPGGTLYQFNPEDSTAVVWLDPDQIQGNGDDYQILTASDVDEDLSEGTIQVNSAGLILDGAFTVVYNDAHTVGNGVIYWPDFTGLTLVATTSGDVDPSPLSGDIIGDVSLSFEITQVPEPASLTLLGMGLIGAGLAARRRRSA
jgi:hypothetical protein